jgi:hypothetical protein
VTRNYANVSTGLWRKGSDFRHLSSSAQRTYCMLITQETISAVGVLPLTVGRWASLAFDTTVQSIRADLEELETARFVAVDEETEELLVRTFVKWDGGYGNPKRRPVIQKAAQTIDSDALRAVLAVEFERVGLPSDWLGDAPPQPPDGQANSLSGRLSGSPTGDLSPSEGVVVTQGLYVEPQPPIHNPLPPTPTADAEATNEGEGEDSQDPKQTLIAEVRTRRPEWSTASIHRALDDPGVAERPWDVVTAALLAVAADPLSQSPGRLRHDGPWWQARPPRPLVERRHVTAADGDATPDRDWRGRAPFGAPNPDLAASVRTGAAAARAALKPRAESDGHAAAEFVDQLVAAPLGGDRGDP